jgi:NDP-sugar pyrophosphorylase family protein
VKALIMAGGEGTRLRPLTYNQPKPMIPMANRPLMEHVIALLRRHGFTDIVVTVAYQANAIENYFGNGAEFGASIAYASEEPPLGTAGSVRNAMRQLDEPFLVISGDVLTDIDLSALLDFHYRTKALATIALRSMPNPLEFGIVMTGPDGAVERFLEKPSWGQVFSDTINTGIYVLEPGVFDFIPDGVVDFSADVFPRLLDQERPLLYGCVTDGYWEDIGTLDAYARAHQDILDGRVQVQLPGFCLRQGIWLGDGAEVDPNAVLRGPAVIGDYCRVEPGRPDRGGGGAGRRVLHRRARRGARRGQGVPVQDGRARGHRQLVDRVGVPRGAPPVRAQRDLGPRQCRHHSRAGGAGGVTVRLAYDDPQSVVLGFIDPAGVDISELAQRKIERVFYREDFRRCLASETGDVAYPARIPDLYAQALVDQVDTRAIRAAHFKVVLDYAFGAASFVMPAVLGKLGAEVLSLNPYAAARRSVTFDRLEHAQGCRPWCGRRAPISGRCSAPTANASRSSTTTAVSSATAKA